MDKPTKPWRPTLDADTRVVRVNMTIPRDLLAAYKRQCERDGTALSHAVAELIRKSLK